MARQKIYIDCTETCSRAASSCEAVLRLLYDDFSPSNDQITRALAAPSEFDSTVQEIFQVVLCVFSISLIDSWRIT